MKKTLIVAAAIVAFSALPASAAMDAAAARQKACFEFGGTWNGVGCSGLKGQVQAFRQRVQQLTGASYTPPAGWVATPNGVKRK